MKLKLMLSIILLLFIVGFNFQDNLITFSQSGDNKSNNRTNTWISEQNNLNITMNLQPETPIIDQKTKISFEIRKLNNSDFFENMDARVTVTDHDGRLFNFNNQYFPISNGKISVDYIFPDDGQHRIILQLYRNTSAFALGSFDVVIPHPPPPNDFFSWLLKSRLF